MADGRRGREQRPPVWVPVAVGVVALVIAVISSRALSWQAHEQVQRTVRLATATLQDEITSQIETRVEALVRMAGRWEIRGGTPFEEWKADAAQYLRDYSGYQAIGWADSSLHVRWIMPIEGNEAALGFDLNVEERRRSALASARDHRRVTITRPIELAQGGLGFIVYVPIFRGDEFGGFISGVFRIEHFLDAVVSPQHLSGFTLAVFESGSQIYGWDVSAGRGEDVLVEEAVVTLPGVSWHVRVAPTTAQLAEQASWAPVVALGVGALVAILLALAVWLAQVARMRVTQVEISNRDLHYQVSERRRAESALRASEERIRLVVETAKDAFVAMDHVGTITEWNGQAERTFGWSRDQALGRNVADTIVPPRHRGAFERTLARVLETGDDGVINRRIERRAMHRDGREISVEFTTVPARMADSLSFNSFVHDITTRKREQGELLRAKGEAEAANRAKGQFLANMSHEIRTPMTAILGYTDLLASPETTGAERHAHVATIRRHGTHLLRIINDILDLSKIEAGKMMLERIACSPVELVEEVAALLGPAARDKGLGFHVSYVGVVPERILGDPTRLRQILMNLVGNAIKFTETGEVRMTVARADTRGPTGSVLDFMVEDSGIGLSEEAVAQLFQPFSQADASTARRFGGTGLGLAISQRLAQMLGGRLEAERLPAGGSRFTLTLDLGPVPHRSIKSSQSALEPSATPIHVAALVLRGRVLLAEDAPDSQCLVALYLRRAGAEVSVADNGLQACELALAALASGAPFGVILMDMQMPELDGYAATARLRAAGYTGPIVALTAHAMAGDRERCLAAGCDDFAAKPIDRTALLTTIRHHLERSSIVGPGSTSAPDQDELELAELRARFVAGLPARADAIEQRMLVADLHGLTALAHRLRGTAGGYGFAPITVAAAELEACVAADRALDEVREHASRVAELCRRAGRATASIGKEPL